MMEACVFPWLRRLDVEGVVEFKTVHSKNNLDEVEESPNAYGEGRLVAGIDIMSTSIKTLLVWNIGIKC